MGLPFRKAGRRLWEVVGLGLSHQNPQNIILHTSVLAPGPGAPGPCNEKLCTQIHPSGGRHQPQDAVCPIPYTSGHQYHHSLLACMSGYSPPTRRSAPTPKVNQPLPQADQHRPWHTLSPSSSYPRIWPHTLES